MKQNKQRKRKLKIMYEDEKDILQSDVRNKKQKNKETCFKSRVVMYSGKVKLNNENVRNQKKNDVEERQPNEDTKGKEKNKNLSNEKQTKILKKNNDLANITHKGCSGSTNWEKFLILQGKQFTKDEKPRESNEKQNPKLDEIFTKHKVTKVVGMDCEMVGAGEDGKDNLLARVSIVNLFGDCLYDKFVKPKKTVTDYRTYVSGVRASDLKNADDFETVQKEVAALIKGKILVGHALKNDLEVLFLSHPRQQIRDSAKFFRKKGFGTPSLKYLAAEYLGVKIQSGEHSSVQDAQAAVQLYNMFRKQWEARGGNKKTNRIDTSSNL